MEVLATCGLEDQLTGGIGFALHLADVWAPAVAGKECATCSEETLSVLLEPFVHCLAFHSNPTVLTRVKEQVLPGGLGELVESEHVGAAKVRANVLGDANISLSDANISLSEGRAGWR